MTWKVVIENGQPSKYAIRRGNQIIAKVYLDGCTLYELWHGEQRIGHYNDAAEAKGRADEILTKEQAK